MNENVCLRACVGVDVDVDVVGGVHSDKDMRNKHKHTTNTKQLASMSFSETQQHANEYNTLQLSVMIVRVY